MDLTPTLESKSDQLNADDLISGPRTITVTKVLPNSDPKQPVSIHFDGDAGKPYKPNLTMRRLIVAAWGKGSPVYIGRSLTLYRNPEVMYGSEKVGGVEISHLSNITGPVSIALTVRRGKKRLFTVQPLPSAPATPPAAAIDPAAAEQACRASGLTDLGIAALVHQISAGKCSTLADLAPDILARLAGAGVTAPTVARCNAAAPDPEPPADDPDDLPAAWAE